MSIPQFFLRWVFVLALSLVLGIFSISPVSGASFLNPASYQLDSILPSPPQPGSQEYKIDTGYLKNARATATREQLNAGITASHDSVFDYSQILGSWFNAGNLPLTARLFEKITADTKEAIEIAKHHFSRSRPLYWLETGDPEKSNGFSYPSGHTTRAFVWAILLSNAFPDQRTALHREARQKAWYRVILGRHFPADVRAGKIYGKFLAAEFLTSPAFQKAWSPVCHEMRAAKLKATTH